MGSELMEGCNKVKQTFIVCEGFIKKTRKNKGQCITGPMATTVQSSKQFIVKNQKIAKNQTILERGSEYNFEKVHFEPKFDLLTPMGPGQEFSRRQHRQHATAGPGQEFS